MLKKRNGQKLMEFLVDIIILRDYFNAFSHKKTRKNWKMKTRIQTYYKDGLHVLSRNKILF